MGLKFIDWFFDDFMNGILEAMKCAVVLILIIVAFPIWIVPFLYWYFAEYEGKPKEEAEENANVLIQNPSWIYETHFDPEREELYKYVEKALGFKLFVWQKSYIEVGEFRRGGFTTAEHLKTLLNVDYLPLDFTKRATNLKMDIERREIRNIQEKLTEAGIPTRTIFWCEADKRKYEERKIMIETEEKRKNEVQSYFR